jgi:hypothetical protein
MPISAEVHGKPTIAKHFQRRPDFLASEQEQPMEFFGNGMITHFLVIQDLSEVVDAHRSG